MADVVCKKCGVKNYGKNGMVRGLQRYLCHSCGCNFTATARRGKPPAMKALALLLYAMGNMSFCGIGRLLQVSDVAVLKWVRAAAKALPAPIAPTTVSTIMVDEMWHFIQKKQTSYGFGEPMILMEAELSAGSWAVVMIKPPKGFSMPSAWKADTSSPATGKDTTASSRRRN